jgi:hypothetical protein
LHGGCGALMVTISALKKVTDGGSIFCAPKKDGIDA